MVSIATMSRSHLAPALAPALALALALSCSDDSPSNDTPDPPTEPTEPTEPPPDAIPEQDPPVIFGEDITDDCPIDIDIHRPAAQDRGQPLVAEAEDGTAGAWTLRNDDMDATTDQIIADRLKHSDDLLRAEGAPDRAVRGAVADEDDLVAIDLHNPSRLSSVYLNIYVIARQAGPRDIRTDSTEVVANDTDNRLRLWSSPERTGPQSLPLQVAGPEPIRVWIEGLSAGRYRLVLIYKKDGTAAQIAAIKATTANPHGPTTPGTVTLKAPPDCHDHVRLSVAVADVFQQSWRQHVFDVLWGGRPVFEARVWPGGGHFGWSSDVPGRWLDGRVHGQRVASDGSAPGNTRRIETIHGAFEPDVQAVGAALVGSDRYAARLTVSYSVEGQRFARSEPLTLMLPDSVAITPQGDLAQGFDQDIFGTRYEVAVAADYELSDQHGRRLVGPTRYERRYGTRLQFYEALGMGLHAVERNDEVQMQYQSTSNAARNFTVVIQTKQRRNAIPDSGSQRDGEFTDRLAMQFNQTIRGYIQQDIRDGAAAERPIFAVSQDIMVLLSNGDDVYDVEVARGNILRVLAPQAPTGAGQWGGIGFRMTLGNRTTLNTGNPVRRGDNHNPAAPP